MEFLRNNFDVQSNMELNDKSEHFSENTHNQKVEKAMVKINAKLEKMSPEEKKKYLSILKDRIDSKIIQKEKALFEKDSMSNADFDEMFGFDVSQLKPLEETEDETIDFDVSSLEPIDDFVVQHKR